MRSFTIALVLVALCSVLAFCPQHVEGALATHENDLARVLLFARKDESSTAEDPAVQTDTILTQDPESTAVETATDVDPSDPTTSAIVPVVPATTASVRVVSVGGPVSATRSALVPAGSTTLIRSASSLAARPSSLVAQSSFSSLKPSSSGAARASASASKSSSSGLKTFDLGFGGGALGVAFVFRAAFVLFV